MIGQDEIDAEVDRLLVDVPDGEPLAEEQVVLLNYALRASGAALDVAGAGYWQRRALEIGVSGDQLQEVITLMAALGVHVFFESSRDLAAAVVPEGGWAPFDPERQALWDRYVGGRGYWQSMHEEIDGFLESLLRMSPDAFEAFLAFVGLPFRAGLVPNLTKELISMAADGCPAHQYLPGMRMHLKNAVHGGAGRLAIKEAMAIAAASPGHVGVSQSRPRPHSSI